MTFSKTCNFIVLRVSMTIKHSIYERAIVEKNLYSPKEQWI